MYHFYTNTGAIDGDCIHITGSDVNHIRNVLRLHTGEKIVICDGQGRDYYCIISGVSEDEVTAKIDIAAASEAELETKLYLFQGIPKKDKMELIIQKAVELGVYEIIPVMTKRVIVKIEDKKKEEKKLERWQTIAESAAKQSGRGIIPEVSQVLGYEEALKKAAKFDTSIIPYENAEGMEDAKASIRAMKGKKSVGIFIGPEGGFEESEIAMAEKAGIHPMTLGKRILRTETAGLAVLSVIMFELS